MEVDLAPRRIPQDDACGRARLDVRIVFESERGERALGVDDVGARHDEVEILVRARLASHERVHPPPAVEPDLDVRRLESVEDGEDVLRPHGG